MVDNFRSFRSFFAPTSATLALLVGCAAAPDGDTAIDDGEAQSSAFSAFPSSPTTIPAHQTRTYSLVVPPGHAVRVFVDEPGWIDRNAIRVMISGAHGSSTTHTTAGQFVFQRFRSQGLATYAVSITTYGGRASVRAETKTEATPSDVPDGSISAPTFCRVGNPCTFLRRTSLNGTFLDTGLCAKYAGSVYVDESAGRAGWCTDAGYATLINAQP